MGYVDLRERREDILRTAGGRSGLRHEIRNNPYLYVSTGLTVAIPYSWAIAPAVLFNGYPAGYAFLWMLPALLGMALVCRGIVLLGRREARTVRSKPGSEKQLLLAIQDAGGSITPIEAALRTSLSVDEAEALLSRFADQGYLFVESRDGALSYVWPGSERRPAF